MRAFVTAGGSAEFQVEDRAERYACGMDDKTDHPQSAGRQRLVTVVLSRLTGLCCAQLTRLIGSYAAKGSVTVAPYQRASSRRTIPKLTYGCWPSGTVTGTLSSSPGGDPATRISRVLSRRTVGPDQFGADLSLSQDRRVTCKRQHHLPAHPTHTDPPPAEGRKPDPHGRFGTAHRHGAPGRQRWLTSCITLTPDQVTQWQVVGATPHIAVSLEATCL